MGSRAYGIGFSDQGAILGAGHSADGAFWFDERSGTWMSSTYYMAELPAWLNDFNSLSLADKYLSGTWDKLKEESYYSISLPDSSVHEAGFSGRLIFPYDLDRMSLGTGLARRRDYSLLKETPFSNTLTTELAIRLIEEEELGMDEFTDYLSIVYSATDNIGHRFGPSSVEARDAIYRLDREIEQLLAYLNEKIGKRNILVYFTAAHGVCEVGVFQTQPGDYAVA
jgi:predicted AlkP superfamily pyrophosphatase or phosphodiesterase